MSEQAGKLRNTWTSTPSKLGSRGSETPRDLPKVTWLVCGAQPLDRGLGDWPAEWDLHWKATLLRGRPSLEALWGKREPWGRGRLGGYKAKVVPAESGERREGRRRQHEGRISPGTLGVSPATPTRRGRPGP